MPAAIFKHVQLLVSAAAVRGCFSPHPPILIFALPQGLGPHYYIQEIKTWQQAL
jgi:hypothetical protein